MDKWEYLDLPFAARHKYDDGPRMLINRRDDTLRSLTFYGEQGWELVSCTDHYATFKRKVQEKK